MMPVFLDTVGLVGVWNGSDQWYAAALAAFTSLLQRQVPLVTTAYVLLNVATRPHGDRTAVRLSHCASGCWQFAHA
jgi:hypothetical protein